jgi:DnaK suppressor protein
MNGLDPRQVELLAGELARLKRDALAAVRKSSGDMSVEDAELFRDSGLSGDGALAEAEFERDVAGAAQARAALVAIVAAERRLAQGEYGACEDCGEPIGYARLQAHPAASRCVRCQEGAEKRGGPALFAG